MHASLAIGTRQEALEYMFRRTLGGSWYVCLIYKKGRRQGGREVGRRGMGHGDTEESRGDGGRIGFYVSRALPCIVDHAYMQTCYIYKGEREGWEKGAQTMPGMLVYRR